MGGAIFEKGDTGLFHEFRIAETATFQRLIARPEYRRIYEKVKNYVYPQLRANPFFGRNIKRLKGEWHAFYRYRIGNFRLFYTIDDKRLIVFVIDLRDRKDAY